jgi:hypothetical protein
MKKTCRARKSTLSLTRVNSPIESVKHGNNVKRMGMDASYSHHDCRDSRLIHPLTAALTLTGIREFMCGHIPSQECSLRRETDPPRWSTKESKRISKDQGTSYHTDLIVDERDGITDEINKIRRESIKYG